MHAAHSPITYHARLGKQVPVPVAHTGNPDVKLAVGSPKIPRNILFWN
jgi:hypothetical protein